MKEVSAVLTIALRDVLKMLRDRGRVLFPFVAPLIFVGLMSGTLQGNLGRAAGFNFIAFIFKGS